MPLIKKKYSKFIFQYFTIKIQTELSSHSTHFFKLLKTSFFIFSSIIVIRAQAQQNSINKLNQSFEDKLNQQSFLKSTKYYAEGTEFSENQQIQIDSVIKILINEHYRQREADQTVLTLDFKKISLQECSNLSNLSLSKSLQCLTFKNSDETQYIFIFSESKIERIFNVTTQQGVPKAYTNPQLVAQYRNQEPILQEELKIADYPVSCLQAIMAIEDQSFLEHSGVSISGIARSIIKNLLTLRKAQGGSTITQQLVKNYFLTPEKTLSRKAKEIYLAIKLEHQWTKDEILQTYLNVIYMGQNGPFQVRGYGSASRYYFNKPIGDLSLAQCALLAAIVNNPRMNNPWNKAEQAQKRRKLVLTKMRELELITAAELTQADSEALPKENKIIALETAPYFFDAVRNQAEEMKIPIEGTTFYTSLNLKDQKASQDALQEGINKLSEKNKSVKKVKEKNGTTLQGVVLSTQHNEGLVTAFVGGQNYKLSQFNRALNSKRQIGSLIKPFVYLTGLSDETLNLNPLSILSDTQFEWKTGNKSWKPEDYDHKFRGDVPYFYALKESLNIPTARLAQQLGINKIITTATAAGLTSNIPDLPSTALGASEHSPFEVLQAYSTLALNGNFQKLSFIKKAFDENNQQIFQFTPHSENKLNTIATSILTGMLKENIRTGTGKYISMQGYKIPVAGKTGTTSNGKDSWFAGYTPHTTTVVWIGFDQNMQTSLTGASAAVPIWYSVMKSLTDNEETTDFVYSPDVEYKHVKIDHPVELETDLIFKK